MRRLQSWPSKVATKLGRKPLHSAVKNLHLKSPTSGPTSWQIWFGSQQQRLEENLRHLQHLSIPSWDHQKWRETSGICNTWAILISVHLIVPSGTCWPCACACGHFKNRIRTGYLGIPWLPCHVDPPLAEHPADQLRSFPWKARSFCHEKCICPICWLSLSSFGVVSPLNPVVKPSRITNLGSILNVSLELRCSFCDSVLSTPTPPTCVRCSQTNWLITSFNRSFPYYILLQYTIYCILHYTCQNFGVTPQFQIHKHVTSISAKVPWKRLGPCRSNGHSSSPGNYPFPPGWPPAPRSSEGSWLGGPTKDGAIGIHPA